LNDCSYVAAQVRDFFGGYQVYFVVEFCYSVDIFGLHYDHISAVYVRVEHTSPEAELMNGLSDEKRSLGCR